MSNEGGESPSAFDFKLFAESLRGDICRILDQKLEIVHERIDKVEAVQSGSKGSGNRRKSAPHESDSSNYSVEEFEPRTRRTKVNFKSKREPIKGVKMQVPPFTGKTDPNAYLEWEKKVELMFNCNDYTEEQQMKLAVMAFSEYAIIWWDQITTSRRHSGDIENTTWSELKVLMRKHFIPSHYHRDLYYKLQNLRQQTKVLKITTRRWR